jgi:hypothetical protein
MPDTDPQWKILRCAQCDRLMKVDTLHLSASLACPSCGSLFSDAATKSAEAVVELAAGADDVVIHSGATVPPARGRVNESELVLDREIGAIPEVTPPSHLPSGNAIPARRLEGYKMPELISNIAEKALSPTLETKQGPKLDASKLTSIDDERFAPAEVEEGAVKVHVARELTGWDVDGEKDDGSNAGMLEQMKSKLLLIIIVLVCVLFGGLVTYGLIRSMVGDEAPVVVEKEEAEIARESLTLLERDAMDDSEKTFAAAGEVLEKFVAAKNFRERAELVRDWERVAPMMEAFYTTNPDGVIDFRPPSDGWKMAPYKSFLLAQVEREDFSMDSIAVELQDDGRFLVDWESFVGYCEIPWGEIEERKSTSPFLVRAKASVGSYFNYGYKDTEWACIQLEDEGNTSTLYGYVRHDSPVLDDLKEVMTPRGTMHLTLRLAHPGGKKAANQFLVKEFVAKGWVFSNDSVLSPDQEESSGE